MAERRAVRIGRLTTVLEVAAELGKVYRDARHKRIDAAFASRLSGILLAMRACLETAEFERRIEELEAAFGKADAASLGAFRPRVVK
jgi:hypothetical protein